MLHCKAPLSWPESIPVTSLAKQRSDNGFSADMPLSDAVNFLKDEIDAAGIGQAVIYCDVEQPHSARLAKKLGSRTGACLHIKYKDKGYVLTCDRWQKLEHNIYAMHLAIRQWANMQRWGIGTLATLMVGFEVDRVPESAGSISEENIAECLKIFGLGTTAVLDDAAAIYHRRAKSFADDSEALTKLNLQMDAIRRYFADRDSVS